MIGTKKKTHRLSFTSPPCVPPLHKMDRGIGGEVLKWTFDRLGKKVNCISAKGGSAYGRKSKRTFCLSKIIATKMGEEHGLLITVLGRAFGGRSWSQSNSDRLDSLSHHFLNHNF